MNEEDIKEINFGIGLMMGYIFNMLEKENRLIFVEELEKNLQWFKDNMES